MYIIKIIENTYSFKESLINSVIDIHDFRKFLKIHLGGLQTLSMFGINYFKPPRQGRIVICIGFIYTVLLSRTPKVVCPLLTVAARARPTPFSSTIRVAVQKYYTSVRLYTRYIPGR